MKQHRIAGTDLEVSTFCQGAMQFGSKVTGEAVDPLFHAFVDAGGTFFDTAHCYSFWTPAGAGASEVILGDYLKRHGLRDRVVIATKGAHPSVPTYRTVEQAMSPARIAADIEDSLGRLQVDVIDLYWLHRDDPRLPAGEIVEMLNAEVERGRIRAFGGSNWTAQRLAEGNRYAAEHGRAGFVASQPRWNLACGPEEPAGDERLKPGVLLAASAEDVAWHAASQLPLVPYAPTANGFFATGGASPERLREPLPLARLKRAEALAAELGATPNQVALAWLLHQPFPVFPILGTSRIDHLRDALGAEDVRLTPEQKAALACQPE